MPKCLHKRIGSVAIFLLLVYFNPAAAAYVLQGEHILELMSENLGRAERFSATQQVTFFNIAMAKEVTGEQEAGREKNPGELSDTFGGDTERVAQQADPQPQNIELPETVKYIFDRAFRSDILADGNRRIHVFANGEAITVIDNARRTAPETRFDLYKDLLLYRSRQGLVNRLSQLNVDFSISSLGRFEGSAAFVIGARYPDDSPSQIWVDKKTFRPIRWIITDGLRDYGSNLEIRYLNWMQLDQIWYPMRVEFLEDEHLVRVIQVQKYAVNEKFARDLFDIQRIRSTYPIASPGLSAADESESMSDVKKTIEEFKKIFD